MTWEKTSCALCALNCGLEVEVENNRIIHARPDKDNPRTNHRYVPCRVEPA